MCKFIQGKKKIMAAVLILGLLLSGCGTAAGQESGVGREGTDSPETGKNASQAVTPEAGENVSQAAAPGADSGAGKVGKLRFLGDRQMNCMTQDGYYYITDDLSQLGKDLWGRHLMYMDFATRKEVYLCNEPGCRHKDKNCTSVLPDEEFGNDCLLFVVNNRLWLVSKDQDEENAIETEMLIDGEGGVTEKEPLPTVIYSMGRDGSDRKKEYTFGQDITVDNDILYDGEDIYLASKKVNAFSEKQLKWHTATQRELVRFRTKDASLEKVCSLQPDDKIRWYVEGCCDGRVILRGTRYNQDLSPKEQMELGKEEYWEYAQDSSELFASLDLADGSVREIYSVRNKRDSVNSTMVKGDFLYVSQEKTGVIQKVDLRTGKAKKLVKLKQNCIIDVMSDTLCCQSWDQTGAGYYFVDMESGEVSHCTLVNHRNGWDLDIKGDTGDKVLAVYDYEGTEKEDGVWDITRYQHGLIDKKDLYQSVDHFQKIDMKEAGL